MYKKINLPEREMLILQALKKSPQTVQSLTEKFRWHNMPEYVRRLRDRPDVCIETKWRRGTGGAGRYGEYHLVDCEQYIDNVGNPLPNN